MKKYINKVFWEIIESYQLDYDILKICDYNKGYKISYLINGLFKLFDKNEDFCLKYIDQSELIPSKNFLICTFKKIQYPKYLVFFFDMGHDIYRYIKR